jgi:hypothetical protein
MAGRIAGGIGDAARAWAAITPRRDFGHALQGHAVAIVQHGITGTQIARSRRIAVLSFGGKFAANPGVWAILHTGRSVRARTAGVRGIARLTGSGLRRAGRGGPILAERARNTRGARPAAIATNGSPCATGVTRTRTASAAGTASGAATSRNALRILIARAIVRDGSLESILAGLWRLAQLVRVVAALRPEGVKASLRSLAVILGASRLHIRQQLRVEARSRLARSHIRHLPAASPVGADRIRSRRRKIRQREAAVIAGGDRHQEKQYRKNLCHESKYIQSQETATWPIARYSCLR